MIRSYIYRLFDAMVRYWRKAKFRYEIRCPHNDFKLVGHIVVINRNIVLGRNVTIYPDVMFFGDGVIQIGDNVSIGNNTIIYSSKIGGGIFIGNDTLIAAHCYIIDANHGISLSDKISVQPNSVAPIYIGRDCWLGTNVTVLKGSVIEDGAVIGAKGLVNGKIEKNAIAVGIPATVKKYRV